MNCILPDNEMGGYMATQFLIAKGHQRTAIIMGPAKYKPLTDRAQGYVRAMLEADMGLVPELMQPSLSQGMPDKGYREMQALLGLKDHPTAVFCVSDRTAFGALRAIKEAGLSVPEDVAVVGFDNTRESEHASPSLTTVHVPKKEMGQIALDRLDYLVKNRQTQASPLKLLMPTRLVVRSSA